MSLYPSLEDMKVDTMARAQMAQYQAHAAPPPPSYGPPTVAPSAPSSHVYPALGDYMGLELSSDVIAQNMPEYQVQTVRIIKKICKTFILPYSYNVLHRKIIEQPISFELGVSINNSIYCVTNCS